MQSLLLDHVLLKVDEVLVETFAVVVVGMETVEDQDYLLGLAVETVVVDDPVFGLEQGEDGVLIVQEDLPLLVFLTLAWKDNGAYFCKNHRRVNDKHTVNTITEDANESTEQNRAMLEWPDKHTSAQKPAAYLTAGWFTTTHILKHTPACFKQEGYVIK